MLGIIEVGPLEHMQRADFERAMNLHFWAPFNLIRQAIPHFRRRGEGRIVNIASIGGKMAVPHLAPYCASKFALVGLSDALRTELARDNIHVTTVTPGLMRTGSQGNAKFKGDQLAEYTWFSLSTALPLASIRSRTGRRSNHLGLPPRLALADNSTCGSRHNSGQRALPKHCREHDEGNQHGAAPPTRRPGRRRVSFRFGIRPSRVNTKRLFVSLELPRSVTERLAELDPHLRGVRWLAPDQMHLTLSFLGDVPGEVEEALKKHLNAIEWKAFFLPISGLGTFPGKGRPNIIWVGVGTGHPHLFQLHKRVQEAALHAGLEPELRSFHPHITLARCRDVSAESVRPFLRAHAAFDAGMIHVESFCLNSSTLTPNGSVYTRELEVPAM